LVDQWHSEIGKFLPDLKDKVIVLGSGKAAHFAKLTIRQVLQAKIIIVAWDNCIKPPYLKMVANLAGPVEPAVNWFSPPFTFITRMILTFNLEDGRLVQLFS
jgi:hypothetical protein